MAIADDQARIEEILQTILAAYTAAGQKIEQQLAAVLDEPSQARKRARLKDLAAEVERLRGDLDDRVQNFADEDLRTIYGLGGATTGVDIGIAFSWSKVHEAAVAEVAKDTLSSMLAATKHMTEDVKRLVRASSKAAALDKLLLGQTAVEAGRELAGTLVKNSIAAIVYKDGSRHGVAEYAQVVMRSNTAIAYNRGTIEQGREHGGKYAILHDGSECCLYSHNLGPRANNLIVDLETAQTYSISHPRCRRSVSILMEVQTEEQAKEAMSAGTYATTPAQDRGNLPLGEAQRRAQQRHTARLTAREKKLAARAAKVGSTQ